MNGPVAVITGAGGGIGLAISLRLGRDGFNVAICDWNETKLKYAGDLLHRQGFTCFSSRCDVSDERQVEDFVGQVVKRFGGVRVLVNNAGICEHNPIHEPAHTVWSRILAVNLTAVYYCSHHVLKQMDDGGRVINISSVSGKVGSPGLTAYCASKHGIIGFTRALALEVAPRRITVNAVCPGWVETEMARADIAIEAYRRNLTEEEFRSELERRIPLGKILSPEDVAGLVAFLASREASWLTGQAINISGGEVMS